MTGEQILKKIGYDNDSITSTEKWIAEKVYAMAKENILDCLDECAFDIVHLINEYVKEAMSRNLDK